MGIWSEPVRLVGTNITLNTSDIPKDIQDTFVNHFDDLDFWSKNETFTLKSFLMNFCNTSKIFGYFSGDYINKWKRFLNIIHDKLSPHGVVEFHF